MTIITQQVDGLDAGKTHNTVPNKRDEGHSSIHATSVFAQYDDGQRLQLTKPSDDKIIIAYNWQGLPFKIVVDGFFGGETRKIFQFIDRHVFTLMDNYATQLNKAKTEEETKCLTQELINTIYKLRAQHAEDAEFTMSIAMTYEKDGAQYCAGFGIGDTGLVLHRAATPHEVIQLAKNIFQAKGKDGFDNFTTGSLNNHRLSIENLSERNSIFNVEVHPGDEIIGYTHLCDLEKTDTVDERSVSELKTDEFDLTQHLYPQIVERNKAHFDARCQKLQEESGSDRFGDDCMISSVTIPTRELQEQLAHPEAFHMHNMDKQDAMGYDWQFRISVLPTPSNLEKAHQALLPILGASTTFKCLTLDSESILSLPLYWDGVFSDIEADTDRDQRGKEICVYMHSLSADQFEKSPEEWKHLLLSCWKALQDAGVEGIGYHHAYGDQLVPASKEIRTPFTYTAFKNYTDRHGLLHKDKANEQNAPDPLTRVMLTSQDLLAHGIDSAAVKRSCLESMGMTGAHVKRAEKLLAKAVTALSASAEGSAGSQSLSNLILTLTELHDSITPENAATLLRENAHLFEQAQRFWPRESRSRLNISPYFEGLTQLLKNEVTADSVRDIKVIILRLTQFASEEKTRIAEDLASLSELFNHSPRFDINPALIETQAYAIQKLYRQLIHLHHEKTMLLEETKQYIHDVATSLSSHFLADKEQRATHLEKFKKFIFYVAHTTGIPLADIAQVVHDLPVEKASFMYESHKTNSTSNQFPKVTQVLTEEAADFLVGLYQHGIEKERPHETASASM